MSSCCGDVGRRRSASISSTRDAHRRGRARQMAGDGRLPVARGGRGDEQRAQLAIDVEVAQMRADQMKCLGLARRQALRRLFCLLLAERDSAALSGTTPSSGRP